MSDAGERDLRAALQRMRAQREAQAARREQPTLPPLETAVIEHLRRVMQAASEFETYILVRLALVIEERFSLAELKALAWRMQIDDENLAGATLQEKAISLVQYCDRRRRLAELVALVRDERPRAFDW